VLGQIVLDNPRQSFLQRDFGVLGTLRFPLDRFRRVEAELSLGGVQRYCLTDFDSVSLLSCGTAVDPAQAGTWERANGGVNPQIVPTLRYGYDTVRFDLRAGPISGDSFLLEVGGGWLPWRSAVYGFARTDAMRYWQISGRMKLLLRLALGTSFAPNETGRVWARSWWLTAGDNLRGYSPFDLAYLIGRNYYVANAELQVPLDPLIRFALFDGILGVAALDFGGVFNRLSSTGGCTTSSTDVACVPNLGLWDTRTLTGVLGVNFLFGPLLLRVHFGHPFDIGGVRTPALQRGSSWVTNVTLRYFFY
jgi:hypothetical protein